MIQSKPSEKGEIIPSLSRMGDVLKKIADGSQLVLTFVGVDVVRNSDQPNVVIGEELLGQSADLDVITTQAAEIFYKHGCCFSLLQLLNHIGKAGAIHRNAGDAIVKKMNQVRVAFFLCDLDEQFFLRWDLSRIFSANNMQCC